MNDQTLLRCWTLWATAFLLGLGTVQAGAVELRTTDYYLNHTSVEPFYAEHGLSPEVVLHVREVVLPGRERSAPAEGQVLLLVHGAFFPGYIAFDTNCENCSMMRNFARHGWDVFALDIEGYGRSTRPPHMNTPAAFPDDPAPVRSAVAVADVARVVEFILFGGGYTGTGVLEFESDEQRQAWVEANRTAKVFLRSPPTGGFLGTLDEALLPGAEQAWYEAAALDPQFGELGGRFRETAVKEYVEIARGGHLLPWEITHQAFYQAVRDFLDRINNS